MFISKHASQALQSHFVNHKVQTCIKCKHPDESNDILDPALLGIIIINRCYTFQVEAMILNQMDALTK